MREEKRAKKGVGSGHFASSRLGAGPLPLFFRREDGGTRGERESKREGGSKREEEREGRQSGCERKKTEGKRTTGSKRGGRAVGEAEEEKNESWDPLGPSPGSEPSDDTASLFWSREERRQNLGLRAVFHGLSYGIQSGGGKISVGHPL